MPPINDICEYYCTIIIIYIISDENKIMDMRHCKLNSQLWIKTQLMIKY